MTPIRLINKKFIRTNISLHQDNLQNQAGSLNTLLLFINRKILGILWVGNFIIHRIVILFQIQFANNLAGKNCVKNYWNEYIKYT